MTRSPTTSIMGHEEAIRLAGAASKYPSQTHNAKHTVSIIINTDGRVKSLATTLKSLRQLDYPNFEVCVVYGPTADGTADMLATWGDDIKVAQCPTRNLSQSRNIGLALSAGEIVAFLDDDSIPEPEWITKIVAPFDNPTVGACGGFLLDHTGVTYQWRFGTANRMGLADTTWGRATPEYNYPYTANFPHVMANSAFRLSAVLSVGGFDEQYIYFLDETDLICRLVDRGYHIVQLTGAPVHHKYAASHIRSEDRFLTSWKTIIRSKVYFSLVNARGHHDVQAAIVDAKSFASELERGLEWGISLGKLTPTLRSRFREDFEQGLRSGLKEGLSANRIFYDAAALIRHKRAFQRFALCEPNGHRRVVCFLTQTYPPGSVGGIGRYVHQLSRALAALGHQVHVLTKANDRDAVDLEDGVWVHRVKPKHTPKSRKAFLAKIPQHVWNYSATMLQVVQEIAVERPIDAVLAPIWDCEGAAFLFDGRWPLITSLHTTLAFYLESHTHKREDESFMDAFARPMLELERQLFNGSAGILANSDAIVWQIENSYAVTFDRRRLGIVAHGQEDWSKFPANRPENLTSSGLRLLFVGRLEERKGIDVLLEALPHLLRAHRNLVVDIVGNDTLPSALGPTYRQLFESAHVGQAFISRVRFHGEIDELKLLGFYASCDVFVAPSRFESFGLILLEAMIFSKPIVACRAGGMIEVVEEGVSGLLAEPGDATSLIAAIEALLDNGEKRNRMGEAGRARYEAYFKPQHMAEGVLNFLAKVADLTEAERALNA